MTTTLVRDSIVGDAWIQQTYATVPPQRIFDEKTGQPTENFLTGPVRLAFVNLFTPAKKQADARPDAPDKYNTILLFPPMTDFALFYEEYYKVAGRDFASYWNADAGQYIGLHSPFHDQVEKSSKYGGFTPRCQYITVSSQFKPPIVDGRGNPIVDPNKVYAGAWAILAVNAYAYGKNAKGPEKRGVGFGIQSVMMIGDDTNLAAGAQADPKQQFKGINVQAPIARPDFAKMPVGQPGAVPPGAPGAPPVPQQHYVPPPTVPQSPDDDISSLFG